MDLNIFIFVYIPNSGIVIVNNTKEADQKLCF